MGDLKLLIRNEDDLENEIKIAKAVSKDINMNFGLEKCERTCVKNVGSKAQLRKTLKNWTRENHISS
jgi:hypothetical protein